MFTIRKVKATVVLDPVSDRYGLWPWISALKNNPGKMRKKAHSHERTGTDHGPCKSQENILELMSVLSLHFTAEHTQGCSIILRLLSSSSSTQLISLSLIRSTDSTTVRKGNKFTYISTISKFANEPRNNCKLNDCETKNLFWGEFPVCVCACPREVRWYEHGIWDKHAWGK